MGMTLKGVIGGANLSKTVKKLKPLIAAGAFVDQLTEKDRGSIISSSMPVERKLEVILNIMTQRIAGIRFSPNGPTVPRTFKPHQFIVNKYMGFWLTLEIFGEIIPSILPAAGRFISPIRNIARIAVVPGSIGAVFDDPKGVVPTASRSASVRYVNPQAIAMEHAQIFN